MRERKFKAWDTQEKKWLDFDNQGDWPTLLAIGFHGLPICIDKDSFKTREIIGWNRDHNIAIVEWTGLNDKNNNPIYEGDLMTHPDFKVKNVGAVTFLKGCFLLSGWDCVRTDFSKGEIIGNIYQNPEFIS